MIRRLLVAAIVTCIAHGLCEGGDGIVGGGSGTLAAKKVGACHIEQFGAYNALADISQRANLPIGLDEVQPIVEPSIAFDFPGGTVAELLDMFTSNVPGYEWRQGQDNLIHVARRGSHVSLLDAVLYYPGARDMTRQEIWQDLSSRPEISAWLAANRCSRNELRSGKEFRSHNDPISIDSGAQTLEHLLDEVATKSGENFWAVLQSAPSKPCRVDIILW